MINLFSQGLAAIQQSPPPLALSHGYLERKQSQ